MTPGWTIFLIFLAAAGILAPAFLLDWWCTKDNDGPWYP